MLTLLPQPAPPTPVPVPPAATPGPITAATPGPILVSTPAPAPAPALTASALVAALAAAVAPSNPLVAPVGVGASPGPTPGASPGLAPGVSPVPTIGAAAAPADSALATQIALLAAQVNAMSKAKEIKDSVDLCEEDKVFVTKALNATVTHNIPECKVPLFKRGNRDMSIESWFFFK